MTAAYAVRRILLTFQVPGGQIKLASGNPGLRIYAHVDFANAPTTGGAQIRVYGLTLSHMNQLSVAGLVFESRLNQNFVTVEAGDETGMATIFTGQIMQAFPDFARQPDVSFVIIASPANVPQMKPVEPTSFQGPTSTSTILSKIAEKAGLTAENNGVSTVLQSPYFPGTAWQQFLGLVRAADAFGFLDGVNKVLAVWGKNGSRSGGKTIISPENGMIGYPNFQALNVIVRTMFTTEIQAGVGKIVTIKSQLTAANGDFTVYNVVHDLMTEMQDGPWETVVSATPAKNV